MKRVLVFVFSAFAFMANSSAVLSAELRMAVTTSFNNSGLSDFLLPAIKQDLGIDVRLLVVGTGQALRLGQAGDVDAVLVHSKKAEEAFVAQGYATHRREIMYNDFVIIGPGDDPAKMSDAQDVSTAFSSIRTNRSPFISRGDDSGTHKRELSIWQLSEADPATFDTGWYREVGAGMGAALNIAQAMGAYIMADRASWLNFANKGDLKLLYEKDLLLLNQYAFLPVNPQKHRHVKSGLVEKLEAWLVSERGQQLIGNYEINGKRLFTPNANR